MDQDAFRPADPRDALFVLKPVFAVGPCLVSALPLACFVALWGVGFLGGFTGFVLGGLGLHVPVEVPFAVFGALALLGLPVFFLVVGRRTYARTEYRFHADRLDYVDGPFPGEPRRLRLVDVRAVEVQCGHMQRRHGLGTVVLLTDAEPGVVRLVDVEAPADVRQRIAELVERSCAEREPARSAA